MKESRKAIAHSSDGRKSPSASPTKQVENAANSQNKCIRIKTHEVRTFGS